MNNLQFIEKLLDIEKNYKTLYVMGCFGAPLNIQNKARYKNNHNYNKQKERQKMIDNATEDTFGFDCVNLIKSIIWGWEGDKNKNYGGAIYNSNNLDDISANMLITKCIDISTNFDNVQVGELMWMKNHVGIYIGNAQVVECSPAWKNGVQITRVLNIKSPTMQNASRMWTKHGKLPFINYLNIDNILKSEEQVAKEVLQGKWGNGIDRKEKLIKAGYDYINIQKEVNKILKGDDKNV